MPLRAIARDSGVIASDDFISPIGVYADCGRLGADRLEGEALVSFTLFAEPNGTATRSRSTPRCGPRPTARGSGKLRPPPVYQCASTGRFEANLIDAVRELAEGVAVPSRLADLIRKARRLPPSATGSSRPRRRVGARAARAGLSRRPRRAVGRAHRGRRPAGPACPRAVDGPGRRREAQESSRRVRERWRPSLRGG